MSVKQLSIFVPNEPGQLRHATGSLARAGVSIKGLCAYDTADFGIVRMIVDDPAKGAEVLTGEAGFLAKTSDVVCVYLEDEPGVLDSVYDAIAAIDVDVQYSYSLTNSYMAIMTSDLEATSRALRESGHRLVEDNADI